MTDTTQTLDPSDLTDAGPAGLAVEDLTIRYGGAVAVDGLVARRAARPAHRPDRPQRRREDHHVQRLLRPAAPVGGPGVACSAPT